MLRRSFVKFMGLFGGLLSTPALASSESFPEPVTEPTLAEVLAQGNTAEGTDIYICERCETRNEMREGVRSNHYFAIEEQELCDELKCWFEGHMDNHDLIVQGVKNRVLGEHKGETSHLLARPVQLTLDYA